MRIESSSVQKPYNVSVLARPHSFSHHLGARTSGSAAFADVADNLLVF